MTRLQKRRVFLWSCILFGAALFAENVIFSRLLIEAPPWYFPLFATALDLVAPVLFLTLALFFRSRLAVIATAASVVVVLFVKTTNVITYSRIGDLMTWSQFSMLMQHADDFALRVQLGDYYTLYAILIGFAMLSAFLWLAVTGCCYIRHREHPVFQNAVRIAALLLLGISLAANWTYQVMQLSMAKYGLLKEYMLRPAVIFVRDFAESRTRARAALAAESPDENPAEAFFSPDASAFSERSRSILTRWGVLPFQPSEKPQNDYGFSGKKRILVVAVESLDLNFIHAVNPQIPEGITDCLDSLVQNYPCFTNFYTASQPTSWGLDSLLLSRVDFTRDLRFRNLPSIFRILHHYGYRSYYFTPVTKTFSNTGNDYSCLFQPDQLNCLEELHDRFGAVGTHYWGIGDDELYNCVLKTLDQEKPEKFICVVSTIDLHHPYTVTGPAAGLEPTHSPFLNALRSTDQNLQVFIDNVLGSDWFDDDSLLVITADHSATHGDNYTKRPGYDPDRIPLILIDKKTHDVPPELLQKYCSQIDAPVTLLNLLNIPVPNSFMGQDIRQKKSFALSKTVAAILIEVPGEGGFVYNFERPDEMQNTPEQQALKEYILSWYPVAH